MAALPSTLPHADYAAADATALAAMVRRGEASPAELLAAALARLAAVEPALGPLVVVPRFDAARAEAAGALPDGPFRGVPFLLKDLFTDLAGTPSTNGSDFHAAAPAAADSTVVARYRAAGLVVFGKTHSPELGGTSTTESRRFGATRNPWRTGLSAGGSSGGAAAAVAAGVVPVAAASDAGGSIIIPASCCGLFGLKPSRGRVPLGPRRLEGAGGLATQHVLSRSVRDSAAFLDLAVAGERASPIAAPPSGPFLAEVGRPPGRLRIALMTRAVDGTEAAPACVAAAMDAAALCAGLGHHVEPAAPAIDVERRAAAERSLRLASLAATVASLEAEVGRPVREDDLEPATWQRYRAGLEVSGTAVLAAREAMLAAHRDVDAVFERFDVVLSPAMAAPPPPLGLIGLDRTDDAALAANRLCTAFAGLYNWTGQPSMSVPLCVADGVPIGVLVAARYGAEGLLFRLAAELEAARPWPGLAPDYGGRRPPDTHDRKE